MKTHVIDGKTYVEVEREANVGEKVIQISDWHEKRGEIRVVNCVPEGGSGVLAGTPLFHSEYRVLEPVDPSPDTTEDLIANLVRRVHSLEHQLRDTQNNVERQGVEIAEIDERTQPKQCEDKSVPTTGQPQVFDLAKIKPFKMSDLDGKTLRVHSATDTAEGISVTTTVAIDEFDGKMYVLESEVVSQ